MAFNPTFGFRASSSSAADDFSFEALWSGYWLCCGSGNNVIVFHLQCSFECFVSQSHCCYASHVLFRPLSSNPHIKACLFSWRSLQSKIFEAFKLIKLVFFRASSFILGMKVHEKSHFLGVPPKFRSSCSNLRQVSLKILRKPQSFSGLDRVRDLRTCDFSVGLWVIVVIIWGMVNAFGKVLFSSPLIVYETPTVGSSCTYILEFNTRFESMRECLYLNPVFTQTLTRLFLQVANMDPYLDMICLCLLCKSAENVLFIRQDVDRCVSGPSTFKWIQTLFLLTILYIHYIMCILAGVVLSYAVVPLTRLVTCMYIYI